MLRPARPDRIRRRPVGVCLALILVLALSACSGSGGGLPEDPQQAVVEAFQNTFEGGATITASLQISDEARQQALADDPDAAKILDALSAEDALTVTFRDGQFAAAVSLGDGRPIQVRALQDAFYLLVDVPAIVQFVEADVDLQQLRSQIGQFALFLGDLAVFLEAALNGEWAGVTDIPDDARQQVRDALGALAGPTPDPEQASEIAAQLGLDSPSAFVQNYLEVSEGEGGTYTATLQLRELLRASLEAAQQVAPGGAAPIPLPSEGFSELPQQISGVTIETEGNQVSAVVVDLVELARSAGADPAQENLSEGDIVLRVEFSEPSTDLLQAPQQARTVTFEEVLSTLEQLTQFFQGFAQNLGQGGPGGGPGGGGAGPQQIPTELPSAFELPQELPSGLELPTPTG